MITGTVLKGKKIKKRAKRFTRLHSTRFDRVKPNWRRPRGIDNKDRKHMNGGVALPSIGYRTDKKFRFRDENNMKRVTVSDKKDLEMIAMNKHDYCGEFSKKLSARTRKSLLEVATNYGIKITNNYSRIEKIES